MNTDPTGNAAPSGGFQNGGWYGGYQYFNGSFAPQAGMINAQSNQQGAGQMVSSEVNRQSDQAQGLKPGTIDNFVANKNANPNNGGGGTGSTGGAGGLGGSSSTGSPDLSGFGSSTPTLNLPGLYTSLSQTAGIPQMEADLTAKSQAFNAQQSKINDNPYLSESDRVGRIQKLTIDYNNDVKTSQDALSMAKQDVQTQLDLQTKQFDINSQVAQQALSEFNMLLSSGALAGASGSDIANITKSTGISSGMIQSAISAQTQKDTPTSLTTVDDGKNQYAVVINTKTGAVISKQVLAPSAPKSAPASQVTLQNDQQYSNWATTDAKNGVTLQQLSSMYTQPGGLSPEQVLQIYNENSPFGAAKETLAQVKAGQFVTNPTKVSTPAKKPFNVLDPSTW